MGCEQSKIRQELPSKLGTRDCRINHVNRVEKNSTFPGKKKNWKRKGERVKEHGERTGLNTASGGRTGVPNQGS